MPWVIQLAILLISLGCSTAVTIAVLGERIANLSKSNDAKVNRDVHDAQIARLDARDMQLAEEISRERHRVNNIVQGQAKVI